MILLWDIPEYSGTDDEEEDKLQRPDGKVTMKQLKKITILEMSVPWIENREKKVVEKEEKYRDIITKLRVENPGYQVEQATFIIDVLGGYSTHLKRNIAKLGYKSDEIDRLLPKLQKIVLSEAAFTINKFKMKVL